MAVEDVPSCVAVVLSLLAYGRFFSVRSAAQSCHGDTTMVTSIPWWRVLVDGKTAERYGLSGDVVFWRSGEILVILTPMQ